MTPFKVVVPEMLAVPPTSKAVLMKAPALIPSFEETEVSSKLFENEAPDPKITNPSKAVDPFTSNPPDINKSFEASIVPA